MAGIDAKATPDFCVGEAIARSGLKHGVNGGLEVGYRTLGKLISVSHGSRSQDA